MTYRPRHHVPGSQSRAYSSGALISVERESGGERRPTNRLPTAVLAAPAREFARGGLPLQTDAAAVRVESGPAALFVDRRAAVLFSHDANWEGVARAMLEVLELDPRLRAARRQFTFHTDPETGSFSSVLFAVAAEGLTREECAQVEATLVRNAAERRPDLRLAVSVEPT